MEGLSIKGNCRRNQMFRRQGANDFRVTYTKFHPNLFRELCTLFSIQIILFINSPSGELSTYGDLDFDAKMKRLSRHGKLYFYEISNEEAKRIKKLVKEYSNVCEKLKAAKRRFEQLQQINMESRNKVQALWAKPVGELSIEELKIMYSYWIELIEKLKKSRQELLAKTIGSTSLSVGGNNSSLKDSSTNPHEL